MTTLFDMELRAFRRDRAARSGPELFLFERAFADCLERIALVQRSFGRGLLIGCPDPGWPERLQAIVGEVDVLDPGSVFATRAGGRTVTEDAWDAPSAAYDLILAVGTLDTVNDVPLALRTLRQAMRPDGLLIGAMSGGETLPRLRAAMRAADQVQGEASAHVHPRVEPSALSPLLGSAGFAMPVVDVDRVPVSYGSMMKLVADLRAMAATNILSARSRRPLSKAALAAAAESFADADQPSRAVETYEILHFAAWAPGPSTSQG